MQQLGTILRRPHILASSRDNPMKWAKCSERVVILHVILSQFPMYS